MKKQPFRAISCTCSDLNCSWYRGRTCRCKNCKSGYSLNKELLNPKNRQTLSSTIVVRTVNNDCEKQVEKDINIDTTNIDTTNIKQMFSNQSKKIGNDWYIQISEKFKNNYDYKNESGVFKKFQQEYCPSLCLLNYLSSNEKDTICITEDSKYLWDSELKINGKFIKVQCKDYSPENVIPHVQNRHLEKFGSSPVNFKKIEESNKKPQNKAKELMSDISNNNQQESAVVVVENEVQKINSDIIHKIRKDFNYDSYKDISNFKLIIRIKGVWDMNVRMQFLAPSNLKNIKKQLTKNIRELNYSNVYLVYDDKIFKLC